MSKKYNKITYYEPNYEGIILFMILFLLIVIWKYRILFLIIILLIGSYFLIRFVIDLEINSKLKRPLLYYEGKNGEIKLQNLKKNGKNSIEIQKLSSGLQGEKRLLYSLSQADIPMYILYDLNLSYNNYKAQIDTIVVTKRNIYILEAKNLSGNLDIDEDGNFIRKFKYSTSSIKNPITQNTEHLNVLNEIFKKEKIHSKIIPLVVLTNDYSYIKFKKNAKKYSEYVVRNDKIVEAIKKFENKKHVIRSEKQVKRICDLILKYNVVDIINEEEIEIIDLEIEDLEKKLRDWRLKIAKLNSIPIYIVFNDETLHELIAKQPKTMEELKDIKGLGENRIKKYGNQIIELINNK